MQPRGAERDADVGLLVNPRAFPYDVLLCWFEPVMRSRLNYAKRRRYRFAHPDEDVMQELRITMWRCTRGYRGTGPFVHYLNAAISNRLEDLREDRPPAFSLDEYMELVEGIPDDGALQAFYDVDMLTSIGNSLGAGAYAAVAALLEGDHPASAGEVRRCKARLHNLITVR